MGKIISMGIQKGGSGKTTTTGMVCTILARKGYRVLAVDFDSQGNLTQLLSQRSPYDFVHRTAFEACKDMDPRPYITNISDNLDLLPAEDFLSQFSRYIFTELEDVMKERGISDPLTASKLLKLTLDVVKDEYDFILIDLPPNLGEQTINGMAASDYACVILQTEPFCKNALDRYLETLEGVIEAVNPQTRLLGIIATLLDRYSLSQFIMNKTKEEYQHLVFDTIIKRRAKIMEYSFTGIQDETRKEDREAQQMYIELVDEMLRRMED